MIYVAATTPTLSRPTHYFNYEMACERCSTNYLIKITSIFPK